MARNKHVKTQGILRGKTNIKIIKHEFLFRKLIKCEICNYTLIGERQKGHVYYRCQTKECPTKTVREELIENTLVKALSDIQLHPLEDGVLGELLNDAQVKWSSNHVEMEDSLKMQRSKISQKIERLTDAFIENVINKEQFECKKEKLLIEQQDLTKKSFDISDRKEAIFRKASKFLELVKSTNNSYLNAVSKEKRKIIKYVTSNFAIQGRKLMITMKSPFNEIANRMNIMSGGLERNSPRTCTPEIANAATTGDNSLTYVADLAINHETGVAEPINVQPILPQDEHIEKIRENMQQLLDIIIGFFEVETQKVENGILKEEDQLLNPNDLSTDDTSSKRRVRQLPPQFNRRRA